MIGILFWFSILVILYTYAGYPALLTLLARLRPRPEFPMPGEAPSVTLFITAYDEEAAIGNKLENSLALIYPRERLQILVVDDGSQDRTAEIVRGYQDRGIELASHPQRRGKIAAINRALPLARGDIILFSDANNRYDPLVLWEIVRPFGQPRVGGVSGAKLIASGADTLGESEGLYWKYESYIKNQETRLGSCTGASGDLFAIRRELYEMPPDQIINEDLYMALRVIRRGYRVAYAPRARSYDSISTSAQGEMERRARIVAGRYQALTFAPRLLSLRQPVILWQIVSHKFLRPLVPFAMAGALLASLAALAYPERGGPAALTLAEPVNRWVLLLQMVFYALALAGNRIGRSGKFGRLLYLPTFLLNSNLAAVVGLFRFITRRQSTRWKRVYRREENPFRRFT